MREPLGYESGIDRADAVHNRRRVLLKRSLIGAGAAGVVLILTVILLIAQAIHQETQPPTAHMTLSVTNNTLSPLQNAGFDCVEPGWSRIGSTGPIAVGETRQLQLTFNPDELPIGFAFDQAGRTLHVPLEGRDACADDGSRYTINIMLGTVTAAVQHTRGSVVALVQTPSTTQPVYH